MLYLCFSLCGHVVVRANGKKHPTMTQEKYTTISASVLSGLKLRACLDAAALSRQNIKSVCRITAVMSVFMLLLSYMPVCAAGKNALRDSWTAGIKEYVEHTSYKDYFLKEIENTNKDNTDSVTPTQLAASYYHLCGKFTAKGEFLAEVLFARHIFNEVEKAAKRKDDFRIMAKYANSAGLSYANLKFYDEAHSMFDKGKALAHKYGFKDVLAQICTNEAQLYYETNRYDKALELLGEVKKLSGESAVLYNNMALLYLQKDDKDKALEYFDKAMRCAAGNDELTLRILINKGSVLIDAGDKAGAERCLGMAEAGLNGDTSPEIVLLLHLNRVLLCIDSGDKAGAVRVLTYIERHVMPMQSNTIKGRYLKELADLYMETGDYVRASKCLRESMQLNDSLNFNNQKKQLFQMMTLYDMAQLRNDNIRLKNEYELVHARLRNRTVTAVATVVIAILLSVLVAVVIRKRRNERRQNEVIREQEKQLLELRQKEYEQEKNKMKTEINRKSRELTLLSMDISSIDSLHGLIGDELAKVAADTGDEDIRKRINAVSLKLRQQVAHKLSEGFKKYFSDVSPLFDERLKEVHPNLTTNDHRLCAYIFMGLTSKEISQITFKEVESVEKSRNRLRKKMGIDGKVSIQEYLANIVSRED